MPVVPVLHLLPTASPPASPPPPQAWWQMDKDVATADTVAVTGPVEKNTFVEEENVSRNNY